MSEAGWLANDPTYASVWSPVHAIEQVRIPVLAIWGERDTQIDPIRGAHAYRDALEQAGNPNYRVEVIPAPTIPSLPRRQAAFSKRDKR